jgi:plastocyanin
VVYLESAPRGAFEQVDPGRAVMDQRNETFVPHVLAVTPARSSISRTAIASTTTCSRSRRARGSISAATRPAIRKSVRFDRPGVVRVFCEIHSHMNAFILVFGHPFFAMTDADGRYRSTTCRRALTTSSPGTKATPPIPGGHRPDGGATEIDFTFDEEVPLLAAQPNLPHEALLAVLSVGRPSTS